MVILWTLKPLSELTRVMTLKRLIKQAKLLPSLSLSCRAASSAEPLYHGTQNLMSTEEQPLLLGKSGAPCALSYDFAEGQGYTVMPEGAPAGEYQGGTPSASLYGVVHARLIYQKTSSLSVGQDLANKPTAAGPHRCFDLTGVLPSAAFRRPITRTWLFRLSKAPAARLPT